MLDWLRWEAELSPMAKNWTASTIETAAFAVLVVILAALGTWAAMG